MKKNPLLFISIVLIFISCAKEEKKTIVEEWKLEYKNDKNGNKVFGNKDELISYVRKGHPIRIGWASRRRNDSTKTVEHIVDAEFITIANGDEVFAQIKPFLAQRPDLTSDTLSITLMASKIHWILGTNGIISTMSNNYSQDTVNTSKPRQFRYDISWFTKNANSSKKAQPLWN